MGLESNGRHKDSCVPCMWTGNPKRRKVRQVTAFRSLTPPKWCAVIEETKDKVTLEQRLAHFIDWLSDRHVALVQYQSNGGTTTLTTQEAVELVRDYVSS